MRRALLACVAAVAVSLVLASGASALSGVFVSNLGSNDRAGGATLYEVFFTLGHSITSGDTITVDAGSTAPGLTFPEDGSYELIANGGGYAVSTSFSNGDTTVSITVPSLAGTINSGTQIGVFVDATNPTAAGTYRFKVHTSQETTNVNSATFSVVPDDPASISLRGGTPQTAGIGTGFGSPLTVHVQDQYGNATPGASVTFTAPASGPSAQFDATGTGTRTLTADGAGNASSGSLTAGTIAGRYTVTASVTGVGTPATFLLTNQRGPAAAIDVSVSQPSIVGDGASTFLATATVTDSGGNPVPGEFVQFSTDAGETVSASDNGDGTYTSAPLHAAGAPGTLTVTATDFSNGPLTADTTILQLAAPPTVGTGPASQVSQTGATLAGNVNPRGSDTTYRFQYGVSDHYGQSAPADGGHLAAGSGAQPVSAGLTGLSPGTTYHYRIMAENAGGTTAGADRTFTTASPPPPPPAGSGRQPGGGGANQRGSQAVLALAGTPKAHGGRVTLTLRCGADGPACRGAAVLTALVKSARARKLTVGTTRFDIGPGKSARVSVTLNSRGRLALRKAHRLRVTLRVSLSGSSSPLATRTLTLAAPKHR